MCKTFEFKFYIYYCFEVINSSFWKKYFFKNPFYGIFFFIKKPICMVKLLSIDYMNNKFIIVINYLY